MFTTLAEGGGTSCYLGAPNGSMGPGPPWFCPRGLLERDVVPDTSGSNAAVGTVGVVSSDAIATKEDMSLWRFSGVIVPDSACMADGSD